MELKMFILGCLDSKNGFTNLKKIGFNEDEEKEIRYLWSCHYAKKIINKIVNNEYSKASLYRHFNNFKHNVLWQLKLNNNTLSIYDLHINL